MRDSDPSLSFWQASGSFLMFLERAIQEEAAGIPKINFETLKQAHLDKLIADMIEIGKRETASARALEYATKAEHIQQIWRTRYQMQYLMIDETRTTDMMTTGRLHNVRFVGDSGTDDISNA